MKAINYLTEQAHLHLSDYFPREVIVIMISWCAAVEEAIAQGREHSTNIIAAEVAKLSPVQQKMIKDSLGSFNEKAGKPGTEIFRDFMRSITTLLREERENLESELAAEIRRDEARNDLINSKVKALELQKLICERARSKHLKAYLDLTEDELKYGYNSRAAEGRKIIVAEAEAWMIAQDKKFAEIHAELGKLLDAED